MKQVGGISWVVVGVGVIALVSATLSVPIWKQNRYADLMKTQVELKKESLSLLAEVSKADMENRSLGALSRIDSVAKAMNLDFNAVPIKVMEIPR
jgi:cell division protein FtsL